MGDSIDDAEAKALADDECDRRYFVSIRESEQTQDAIAHGWSLIDVSSLSDEDPMDDVTAAVAFLNDARKRADHLDTLVGCNAVETVARGTRRWDALSHRVALARAYAEQKLATSTPFCA